MRVLRFWPVRLALGTTALVGLLGAVKQFDRLEPGLQGRYFLTKGAQAVPMVSRADAPPFTRRLATAWPPPAPAEFSATWEGSLLVRSGGAYTFGLTSDDGSRLYLDGVLVIDNSGQHGPLLKTGAVELARGVHAIFLEYTQSGGGYELDLLWARGSEPLAQIPASALGTSRVSLVHFLASAALWKALAGAEWVWVVSLLLAAAAAGLTLFQPLKRALQRETLWPVLRWILLGSAALNVAGIWWGLPAHWVAAEVTPKTVFEAAQRGFANGWFDTYPPLHYYLLAAAMSPLVVLERLGRLDLATDTGVALLSVAGRMVSVIFAAGTIVAAARCGSRLFGPRAGLLAAAACALGAPFIYYAKTANTDLPYVFWFSVSMVFYLRFLDERRRRDVVGFAAAAAAAVCSKDQAYGLYLLMPLPFVHAIWRDKRAAGAPWALLRSVVDRRLIAGTFTAAVLFAVFHNLPFNLSGFRKHVEYIVGPGSVNYQVFEPTFDGQRQLLLLTIELIQQNMGWPLFVAAVAGVALGLSHAAMRRASIHLLVPAVSYYLTFIAVVLYDYDRFVLPIGFSLAIFAGLAVDRFLGVGARLGWRTAAAGGVFGYTLLYSGTVDVLMIGDARYAAFDWLSAHVRKGDSVGTIFDTDYLPRLDLFDPIVISTAEELEGWKPAYYVLNADYARAVPPESRAGRLIAGLQDGTLGYRRVFRYRRESPWPWLPGAHRALTGPRQETRVFVTLRNINPTIEVYERLGR